MGKVYYAVLFLLLVLAAVFYYVYGRNDKVRIRKNFASMLECVEKRDGEGNASTAVKMLGLGKYLCDDMEISVQYFPYNGRNSSSQLVSLVFQSRSYCSVISFEIVETEIEVADDTAELRCAVKGHFESKTASVLDELFLIRGKALKQEGKWRFASFASLKN